MPINRSALSLVALCAIVILLSLGGLIWAVIVGMALTLDGLLLIFTCLMMAGIFFLMLLWMARENGWLPTRSKKPTAPTRPAPPSAGEGK